MGSGASKKSKPTQSIDKNTEQQQGQNSSKADQPVAAAETPDNPGKSANDATEADVSNESESPPLLSQLAAVDEDKGIVAESEVSYAEFPTHVTLRLANERHAKKHKAPPKDKAGNLPPFPSRRRKTDFFKPEKLQHVDKHCQSVSTGVQHRQATTHPQALSR